jgi:hypothetical protein
MSLANKFIKRTAPILSTIIGYIRDGTALLTPKDDWFEGFRRRFATTLDPITRPLGRPLVAEVRDSEQFVTVPIDSDAVERIVDDPYQRNGASTRKFRKVNGKRQWADGTYVYDLPTNERQHHIFFFENGDGTTDIYGHLEQSAEADPYGHVTDGNVDGDPLGLTRGLLEERHINYE